MSYRATLYSPVSVGLGAMPGSSGSGRYSNYPSTYSSSYSPMRRTPSATRKTYNSNNSSYQPSRPSSSSRPLPTGPGPLDTRGRLINANDLRKNSTSSTKSGPIRGDHSYSTYASNRDRDRDFLSSTNRQSRLTSNQSGGSSSSLSNSSSSVRSRRAASLANLDRVPSLTTDTSNLKLNGYDGVKASPRPVDSDDSINGSSRVSRKEKYEHEDSWKTSTLPSRTSNSSISGKKNDDLFSPRNDTYGRSVSVSRDIGVVPKEYTTRDYSTSTGSRRKDSLTDTSAKPLSRQSSNSSISTQSQNSGVSKYSSSGKVGLRNIGNTCFMNSILQCLSNTRPLLDYCLKEDYVLDKNKTTSNLKGALMIAYANLIASFWKDKNNSYVSPNSFKSQIQKFAPRFSGYQQQDAQEFLRYLLEGLHEDVNRVTSKPKHVQIDDKHFISDSEKAAEYWKNYLRYDHSRIVEIFVGQLKSELKFQECGHRSVTFDPFWDLSLPIPKGRSECDITDCLSLFMKEETLDGDERPTCTECKKRRSCTKSFAIQKFPQILVFHLKRFSQERYSRKITTLVNFSVKSLDLSEFTAENGGSRPVYNLYAVSEHSGTTHGGHYTAKCKHAFTEEWNSFNDTRVSPCGANQGVSSEAYVLFFELASGGQSHL